MQPTARLNTRLNTRETISGAAGRHVRSTRPAPPRSRAAQANRPARLCGRGGSSSRSTSFLARPRVQPAAAVMEGSQAPSGGGEGGRDGTGGDGALGVVIVDHGSRRRESNAMLDDFVALYSRVTGRSNVQAAHMEIAEPSIAQAIDACVAAGARRVVVAPYFLSRGRHIQEDIPALVAEAAAAHPGVECVIAEPIGIDALMARLIEARVHAADAGSSHLRD